MSMKKIFSTVLVLVMITLTMSAVDIWFTWSPNPPEEFVTSYVIQQKNMALTNAQFIPVVTVKTNEGTVKGVGAGIWAFRVVAINGVGTSAPSSVVTVPTNAPSMPQGFQTK